MRNAKGEYNKKTFECPECKQKMRRNTLVREITPREWGMWLYASIRIWNKQGQKFYDRIAKTDDGKFILAERIKKMGIANDFWDGWKEAKTYDTEKLKAIVYNAYILDYVQKKLV